LYAVPTLVGATAVSIGNRAAPCTVALLSPGCDLQAAIDGISDLVSRRALVGPYNSRTRAHRRPRGDGPHDDHHNDHQSKRGERPQQQRAAARCAKTNEAGRAHQSSAGTRCPRPHPVQRKRRGPERLATWRSFVVARSPKGGSSEPLVDFVEARFDVVRGLGVLPAEPWPFMLERRRTEQPRSISGLIELLAMGHRRLVTHRDPLLR
jgi:hypothetical protein